VRLLVTGAGGGLGRAFLDQVPGHHDVAAFTHADLDVADHHAVMRAVIGVRPDAILNLAAMTDVDGCETWLDEAYRANTIGPWNIALAARRVGAMLLHVSTDYVFDGEKATPYDELDAPAPLGAYGRSKLGGEERIRAVLPEHVVVRTSYVFGAGDDYVSKAVDKLARLQDAAAIADCIGSPTYVQHLAARLIPLVLTGRFGTFHLAGPHPASRHELLWRIKAIAGLAGEVQEQHVDDLGLAAARPRNSALVSLFLAETGIAPMPPLDIALKELIDARDR
jgi:dTDP-4-dehydrorhamnose reductase